MEKRNAAKNAVKLKSGKNALARAIHQGGGNYRIMADEIGWRRDQETYNYHRNAICNATKKVDNDPPKIHYADISPCMYQTNDSYFRKLDKENEYLLQIMSRLYRRPGRIDNQLKERRILKQARNEQTRRDLLRVTRENRDILQNLSKVDTVYSREKFLQEFELNKKKMHAIARFPVAWDEHRPIYQKQFMKTRPLVTWYPPLVPRRKQKRQNLYTQYVITPKPKIAPRSERVSFQSSSGRKPTYDKVRFSINRPPTKEEHDEMIVRLTKTVATLINDGDKSLKQNRDETTKKVDSYNIKSEVSSVSSDLYRISSSEQLSKVTNYTLLSRNPSSADDEIQLGLKQTDNDVIPSLDIQNKTVDEESAEELLFDVLDDSMTAQNNDTAADISLIDKESDSIRGFYSGQPNQVTAELSAGDDNDPMLAEAAEILKNQRDSFGHRDSRPSDGSVKQRSGSSKGSFKKTGHRSTAGFGKSSKTDTKKESLPASVGSRASTPTTHSKDASSFSKRVSRFSAGSRDKASMSTASNKDNIDGYEQGHVEPRTRRSSQQESVTTEMASTRHARTTDQRTSESVLLGNEEAMTELEHSNVKLQ